MTPSPEDLIRAHQAQVVRRALRRALTVPVLVTALTLVVLWVLILAVLPQLDQVLRAAGHTDAIVRLLTVQGPWVVAACTLGMLTALALNLAGIRRATPALTRSGHEI